MSVNKFEITVGKKIRELRERNGYSREYLSELACIGSKFLYEIETGKKGMSAYTLYNISKALNVSCDYILTGKERNSKCSLIDEMLSSMGDEELLHIEQIIKHIAELKKI